ncbi:3-phenylpropionate dioxygenase [Rhodococcus sp. 05-340-1]|nr:3-phenylpropionate dioxygenase [Rhodococcus sp. 05-340-2]OZD69351.1 3-phenylpropionate dioxygenase [Rhodococcus sp. 05-340-1]
MVKHTYTAEELYAVGLRDRWYALCPSSFVETGAMKAVKRLGESLLLFRELDGTLHVLEDRCPHRGAPLSQGAHLGDRIACSYHGVQVNGAGTVVSVPGMPGCKLEGRTVVPSLPVREMNGAILAFFGSTPESEVPELVAPPGLADPESSAFLCYAEWDSPWRFAMENVMDPMHGAFLHRNSHTMYDGDTSAQFRVRETDRGYLFEKTTQQGVNFDWVEYGFTGVDWLELSIPYPPTAGPGGPFGVSFMVTPVDERRCVVFAWRTRKSSGWERSVWRFLYKTKIEERHWQVLEQDREMLEGMAADADQAENLYQHDLGLVRIRRMFQKLAREQAAALAGGS